MNKVNKGRFLSISAWVALGLALCFLILVILMVVTPQKTDKPQYEGPVAHIKTGFIGEYASLILVADQQGFFARNGVDVSLQEFKSGPEALTALLTNQVDTAVASDFAGVSHSFTTQELRLLATVSKSEAFYMVGRKDHGITDNVASLKGKRIGITKRTVGEFYIGQFLTFNNIALKDVQMISMTQAELVEALKKGTIDAAALFNPNASRAKEALKEQRISRSIQSNQAINTVLYSTANFINKQSAGIKRYMQALAEAEEYMKQNESQARDIIAKKLLYDAAYVDSIWSYFDFSLTLDEELLLNMEDEALWAIENKLTPATTMPNYMRLVYFDGMEAAKPQAITVIR